MKTLVAILTVLALLPVAQISEASDQPKDASTYKVSIPEENHKIAIVEASLLPTDRSFYMFPGANQLSKRWATFVSDFQINDENGQPLAFLVNDDGSWQLEKMPKGRINVRYQVNLDHESHSWSGGVDGAAYARDWGVFYTARSLFVVNGATREGIQVTFALPASWQVTTPWQETGNDHQFLVADHQLLSTSLVFAGTHKEISITLGSLELLLALGGDSVIEQASIYSNMASGVLQYYTDLMGGVPKLESANGVTRSVVVINSADQTDGEAIGNNISMLVEPGGDQMSETIARFIFAHEFFHLWNGKSFAPHADDTEWFKEGFSNFYTLKALRHIGFLDDESFLDLLANFFYQRYDSDDGAGRLSMTDGHLKHDHWGLIYSGGMLVAIAQDLQIRSASGNENSLDDLMRVMFDRYGDSGYDLDDVQRELSHLNGSQQDEFFQRYIVGTEKFPIAKYLALAHIETRVDNGRTMFRLQDKLGEQTPGIRRGFFGKLD